MIKKCVCCVCLTWFIYGFKRAKIQYFQPKVGDFAIFTFKKGAFKHTSNLTHGEVSNALFGLQSSRPRRLKSIAHVKTVNAPFFDGQKMCKIETSQSKFGWATCLLMFSVCIAFLFVSTHPMITIWCALEISNVI